MFEVLLEVRLGFSLLLKNVMLSGFSVISCNLYCYAFSSYVVMNFRQTE